MSANLTPAAEAVGVQLIGAERASDAIVLTTAALSVSMIEARMMAGLPLSVGQAALSDVAEAHACAVKLRFHLVRAHSRMATDATALGVDWTMWGDLFPTPPIEDGAMPSAALVA